MSRASRRRKRVGFRARSLSRPHVECLEFRLAAGTVLDVFGSSAAAISFLDSQGRIAPSAGVTATSQRLAPSRQFLLLDALSTPIAHRRTDVE